MHDKGYIINNKEGNPYRIVGISSDITNQKRNQLVRDIISNITEHALSSENLNVFLDHVKNELTKLIDTSNFFIALYNAEKDTLSLPYISDSHDKFEEFPAGKSISSYVLRKNKSILLNKE